MNENYPSFRAGSSGNTIIYTYISPFNVFTIILLVLLKFYLKYVQIVKQKSKQRDTTRYSRVLVEQSEWRRQLMLVACFLSLVFLSTFHLFLRLIHAYIVVSRIVWVSVQFFFFHFVFSFLFICFDCRRSHHFTWLNGSFKTMEMCVFPRQARVHCCHLKMIDYRIAAPKSAHKA